jgi:colanic acid/amylovoran biosynthesis glycosyltransferase
MKNQPRDTSTAREARTLCIVTPYPPSLTETFIRAHAEGLPARTVIVHGWRPSIGEHPVLPFTRLVFHKLWRTIFRTGLEREKTAAYLKVLRDYNAVAALAEYGGCGVWCAEACRRAGVPLIVHFHGHDASDRAILEMFEDTYAGMFQAAAAIIAVSRAMRKKLISLGAPPEKIHYNPYGVDCEKFFGADPKAAPPVFIAVGRFTAKKAPQNTLAAFAEVSRFCSDAKLLMIGEGPLLNECKELAEKLGVGESVTFLGAQEHSVIEQEMRRARCFVQHSVVAPSGDSEGTPVSIIEAGATGLPVVSTRHAGIPDVVIEGETGFLVDEGDVHGMAECMLRMTNEPELAGRMGAAAQKHIRENFSRERSLNRLWSIIESCINEQRGGSQSVIA